ncbi:DedA family protein [Ornithinibacillus gellani]|uniref:DedA family protein n=1 Tax=Ornithinibacillus gellani TaxID=2293253 RepID=UPI000F4861A9|nr:DedA family protein [Ornithinibacillus gellani]TQS70994.1 DedA family protein [Ornithinibacillus gellani]
MGTWYDFISQYGYIAIIVILSLGIIGLPIPDEVILTYLGYIISMDGMKFSITFVAALIGAVAGISISYFLGVKLGEPFIRRYGPKLFISDKTIDRTNRLFRKYGPFVLIISYFIPGIRHVAAYVGGITKYSFKRFMIFAYVGALFWVFTFIAIGRRLGENWGLISTFFHQYIWLIGGLALALAAFGGLYYIYRNHKFNNIL